VNIRLVGVQVLTQECLPTGYLAWSTGNISDDEVESPKSNLKQGLLERLITETAVGSLSTGR
jgi:hypothetical protein